ncbi:MAG: metal ABC transporter permease [Candidatus Sumerlaeia bacterium]|nr:metal ABC transporter permease [Candidatus Sumerlaeia bacterium]
MPSWWIPEIDGWIVAAAALSAMSCALLGNFLVLRRLSMMGDALSHAALPGLVVAFLLVGSRDSLPMFLGALAIGIVTAMLVQAVTRFGQLDEGASMGVVFTALFAIGLVLIERVAHAGGVDLDPSCVLYGAVENAPLDTVLVLGRELPRSVLANGGMLALNGLFVALFYKELKIASFDPALATTQGINAQAMHYALMSLVAATVVTAFWTVGSILVIAMLIVPGATAFLLTGRLLPMILLSLVAAGLAAFLGHLGAVEIPARFGFEPTSTSGMMAAVSGAVFAAAVIFSPREGVVVRTARRLRLGLELTRDDLLGQLYRTHEAAAGAGLPPAAAPPRVARGGLGVALATRWLLWRREARRQRDGLHLTERGLRHARRLVRTHRLWEGYLVERAGLKTDHVHDAAHLLEHVTDDAMRHRLAQLTGTPEQDPHRRPIPPELDDET